MTPHAVRALAVASLTTVVVGAAIVTVAALPTTRVSSERSSLAAPVPGDFSITVSAGAHVTVVTGQPGVEADHLYFVTRCSVRADPNTLTVACPDGTVERWMEPSRVWVILRVPAGTSVTARVSRDGFFRAEPPITVASITQLEHD